VVSAALSLSAAGGDPGLPEKEHAVSEGAAAAVEEILAQRKVSSEQITVGWKDLTSGEEYYYNGDEHFYGASLYKVALNMYYAEKVAAGEMTWDSLIGKSQLGVLSTGSLEKSNNGYSYQLYRAMGSYRKFRLGTAYLYGLTEEEAMADRAYLRDHWITSRRMIVCLNTLYSQPERFPMVNEHLLEAQPGRYFRLREDRWPIAQKYGAESVYASWLSTAGIVYVPDRPFLLVVMTRNLPRAEETITELCVRLGDYALTLKENARTADG
jgi:hypothetical protein